MNLTTQRALVTSLVVFLVSVASVQGQQIYIEGSDGYGDFQGSSGFSNYPIQEAPSDGPAIVVIVIGLFACIVTIVMCGCCCVLCLKISQRRQTSGIVYRNMVVNHGQQPPRLPLYANSSSPSCSALSPTMGGVPHPSFGQLNKGPIASRQNFYELGNPPKCNIPGLDSKSAGSPRYEAAVNISVPSCQSASYM